MVKKTANPAILQPLFNFPLRFKYIFLAIIGFVFYANSILNKYAFDDNIAIQTNAYVQMGFAGIPKILMNDSYATFYTNMGGDPSKQLSGGRFRPLSEITFAIEQQLFGGSAILPYFRHLVNVLAYMACIIAIFYFLKNFLLKRIPGGTDIAFIATLLFAIHPIHTEVVANIKSLDEILSLLFIMLTFICSLKYLQTKRTKYLVISLGSFLFALLSKEYAVTLLFFIPLLFYLLEDKKPISAIKASIPYYGIFVVYLFLRYNAVGFHNNTQGSNFVMNNPYLYATVVQKMATKCFVLGKYLRLLCFPYPLASDYSYYQIPYHSFSDISVIFSLLIYAGGFIWGTILTAKKSVLSFAVFFFLLNVLMISNFLFDIGAPMGERLVFHSSLGFVIVLSYYSFHLLSILQPQTKKNILMATLSLICIACFGETIIRNAQWKDNTSLFVNDVNVVPNSFLVNINAAWGYMGFAKEEENSIAVKGDLDSAHKYLLRALHFTPEHEAAYLNLGVVYLRQGLLDSANYCYRKVEKLHPGYPGLQSYYSVLSQQYFSRGLYLAMKDKKPHEGIICMKKALLIDSTNAVIWYNMAIAYYQMHQYDSARYAFTKTLQYKPDSLEESNAKKDIEDLMQMKQQ